MRTNHSRSLVLLTCILMAGIAMLASGCGARSTPASTASNAVPAATASEDSTVSEPETSSSTAPAAGIGTEVVDPFTEEEVEVIDLPNGWIVLQTPRQPAPPELLDRNGDGRHDTLRQDTDSDGVIDREIVDTTGDGVPNEIHIDADGDGIFETEVTPPAVDDGQEAPGVVFAPVAFPMDSVPAPKKRARIRQADSFPRVLDTTGNGLVDRWEYDRNSDGEADLIRRDTNADLWFDWWIADDDFDGIFERSGIDLDYDGFDDVVDGVVSVFFDVDPVPTPPDHPSAVGEDTTGNDKIDRVTTSEGLAITTYIDADGDGIFERIEIDSRGDGSPDIVLTKNDPDTIKPTKVERDTNGDGSLNRVTEDTTGDGRVDTDSWDTDGDGQDDRRIRDTDADGVADVQFRDTTDDGKLDTKETDADGNGVSERRAVDTTGDGVADRVEHDKDQDGVAERTQIDTTGDQKADTEDYDRNGNGVPDATFFDSDGDGKPDTYQVDKDENGRPERTGYDTDGDSQIDVMEFDENEDGVPEARETDIDGDQAPDTREEDTTGDGEFDTTLSERNEDGTWNKREVDTDGDGTPDRTDRRGDDGEWDGGSGDTADSGGSNGDGGAGASSCLEGTWDLDLNSISQRANAAMQSSGGAPDDIFFNWVGGGGSLVADGDNIDYRVNEAVLEVSGMDNTTVTLTMTMGYSANYSLSGDRGSMSNPEIAIPVFSAVATVDGFSLEVPVDGFAELFADQFVDSFRFVCVGQTLKLFDSEDLPASTFTKAG